MEDPLSEGVLAGEIHPGDTVVVDVVEEEIRLRALELVKGETPS
ncbi:MAG: hypothetical protein MUP04_02770 [Anaerolineae bacterium]|nr:hypothetical protein [Anaerolineae bacterium]